MHFGLKRYYSRMRHSGAGVITSAQATCGVTYQTVITASAFWDGSTAEGK